MKATSPNTTTMAAYETTPKDPPCTCRPLTTLLTKVRHPNTPLINVNVLIRSLSQLLLLKRQTSCCATCTNSGTKKYDSSKFDLECNYDDSRFTSNNFQSHHKKRDHLNLESIDEAGSRKRPRLDNGSSSSSNANPAAGHSSNDTRH
jgi:hypothetical protein